MSQAPFVIDPDRTAIAIAYRNKNMIADTVLPRVPVGKQEFKYFIHSLAEGFTVPDTKVGRKSQPNQVEFTGTEVTASTDDHGLDDPVPQNDIDNAPENYDPLDRAIEGTMNLIELAREARTAALVFNANSYAAANKVTLSGTGQWSDFTNSDPLTAILNAFDSMIMRPNIGVVGQLVATKLMTHPAIVKAYNRTAGDKGVVPLQFLADQLGLESIEVGAAFVNTAKKGQTPTMARAWGKHAAFLHRDLTADTRNGITFGFTAQWRDRVAGTWEDRNIGLHGGIMTRAGESVKELVAANDLGYFFENAIA